MFALAVAVIAVAALVFGPAHATRLVEWIAARRRGGRSLRPFVAGADARLMALSDVARGRAPSLTERAAAVLPPRSLTDAERQELAGLRGCGFTWEELEEFAPLWGLDSRAVEAERARLADAVAAAEAAERARPVTPAERDAAYDVVLSELGAPSVDDDLARARESVDVAPAPAGPGAELLRLRAATNAAIARCEELRQQAAAAVAIERRLDALEHAPIQLRFSFAEPTFTAADLERIAEGRLDDGGPRVAAPPPLDRQLPGGLTRAQLAALVAEMRDDAARSIPGRVDLRAERINLQGQDGGSWTLAELEAALDRADPEDAR